MSNNINFLLQAKVIKYFTHCHFNSMNFSRESEIYIGKDSHRRRYSGLLERPVQNSPEDDETFEAAPLRRRSSGPTHKHLNTSNGNLEKRRKSLEFTFGDSKDDTKKIMKRRTTNGVIERNIDLNKAYLGDVYFPEMDVRVSPSKSNDHTLSEKRRIRPSCDENTRKSYTKYETVKKSPKADNRYDNKRREIKNSGNIQDMATTNRYNKKRRDSGKLRKPSDDFNTAFIEEVENDEDLDMGFMKNKDILENIDITNFDDPARAVSKSNRGKKDTDDLNNIKQYYLNKSVKKRSNLETIFEVPKKNSYMTVRKFKRFINFDEFNKTSRVKRRQFKAIKINPTLYKLENINTENFESLFKALSDLN